MVLNNRCPTTFINLIYSGVKLYSKLPNKIKLYNQTHLTTPKWSHIKMIITKIHRMLTIFECPQQWSNMEMITASLQ